eukprot:TRINITY_DN4798_c0_g1_i1.p1 TRINITY_DN4798_c0_g1~~TRINITY_DN4798_c0_g1_i1.p1  ORF type:complete len:223 (+),score=69.67 TRINITY_DN4798_c0_g1_i1:44-712(+)
MSCACKSGGSGGCGEGETSLEEMIERASKNWSMPIQEEDAHKWDFIFNDIGMGMSGGNAQDLKPLASIYNKKGPKEFLTACQDLLRCNIKGHLISWAFQFVNQDEELFLQKVKEADSSLINYINKEADFFECFSSNPKVGRAKSFKNDSSIIEENIINSGQSFSLKDRKLISEKKSVSKDEKKVDQLSSNPKWSGLTKLDKMLVIAFVVCLSVALIFPNLNR